MKAGFFKSNISPEKALPGRLGLCHFIKPYHDIFAKAVAFLDDELVLTISCEIVGLTMGIMNRVKDLITKESSIKRENIILLGTHTHSSPFVWDIQSKEANRYNLHVLDEEWLDKLISNTANAGIKAIENLSHCEIYEGISKTKGVTSNRVNPVTRWSICEDDEIRNAPVGFVDDNVRILFVRNKTGSIIISNFACHPSAYGGGKTVKISPDFPYFSELSLKEKYDIEFLTYWQGCAGNSNSGKYVKYANEDEVKEIAENYTRGIVNAMNNLKSVDNQLKYKYKNCDIEVGSFIKSEKQARMLFNEKSEEILSLMNEGKISDNEIFKWRLRLKQLDVSVLSDGKSINIDIQCICFGKLNLVFVPGEWYIENYYKISDLFKEKNIVITTLNTFDLLYVPSQEHFDKTNWYGVKEDMRVLGDNGVIKLINETIKILK